MAGEGSTHAYPRERLLSSPGKKEQIKKKKDPGGQSVLNLGNFVENKTGRMKVQPNLKGKTVAGPRCSITMAKHVKGTGYPKGRGKLGKRQEAGRDTRRQV